MVANSTNHLGFNSILMWNMFKVHNVEWSICVPYIGCIVFLQLSPFLARFVFTFIVHLLSTQKCVCVCVLTQIKTEKLLSSVTKIFFACVPAEHDKLESRIMLARTDDTGHDRTKKPSTLRYFGIAVNIISSQNQQNDSQNQQNQLLFCWLTLLYLIEPWLYRCGEYRY